MNRPRFAPNVNNNNRNDNNDLLLISDMMYYHSNICYQNNQLFEMILNYLERTSNSRFQRQRGRWVYETPESNHNVRTRNQFNQELHTNNTRFRRNRRTGQDISSRRRPPYISSRRNTNRGSRTFDTVFTRNLEEMINNTLSRAETRRSPLSTAEITESTTELSWDDISNNSNQMMCPISQQNFVSGDSVLKINTCGHIFKKDCLLNYFSNYNHVCPVCRHNVRRGHSAGNNETDGSNNESEESRDEVIPADNFREITSENDLDNNQRTFYFDYPTTGNQTDYSNNLTRFINNITDTLVNEMRNTTQSRNLDGSTNNMGIYSTTFDFFLPQLSSAILPNTTRINNDAEQSNDVIEQNNDIIEEKEEDIPHDPSDNIQIGETISLQEQENIINQALDEFDEENDEIEYV
jgi:hypothetical protein